MTPADSHHSGAGLRKPGHFIQYYPAVLVMDYGCFKKKEKNMDYGLLLVDSRLIRRLTVVGSGSRFFFGF